MIKPYYLF